MARRSFGAGVAGFLLGRSTRGGFGAKVIYLIFGGLGLFNLGLQGALLEADLHLVISERSDLCKSRWRAADGEYREIGEMPPKNDDKVEQGLQARRDFGDAGQCRQSESRGPYRIQTPER